jgi:hypothetical protein
VRRVIRIFGAAAAGISLLICVAVVVMWARSYSGSDFALWVRSWRQGDGLGRKYVQVMSSSGKIYVEVSWTEVPGRNSVMWEDLWEGAQQTGGRAKFQVARLARRRWDLPYRRAESWWPIRWQRWIRSDPPDVAVSGVVELDVAHWLAAAVFSLWPGAKAWAWWKRVLRRWKTRRKFGPGLCSNCGYDLRASPERCPECGAIGK